MQVFFPEIQKEKENKKIYIIFTGILQLNLILDLELLSC